MKGSQDAFVNHEVAQARTGRVFFFFNFYWGMIDLQCCVNFCCTAKRINLTYSYIPFSLDFLSMSPCGVPCAIQQVLISYLFYTQYQQFIYINPNLPILPTIYSCPWHLYICSLHLCPTSAFKQVHLYHFSRFHIYVLIYDICFSPSKKEKSHSWYVIRFVLGIYQLS